MRTTADTFNGLRSQPQKGTVVWSATLEWLLDSKERELGTVGQEELHATAAPSEMVHLCFDFKLWSFVNPGPEY